MIWEDVRLLEKAGIPLRVYGSAAKGGVPVITIPLRTNRPLITSLEYCGQFVVRERKSFLISYNEPTVAGLAPDRTIMRFDFPTPLPRYYKLPGWLLRFQRASYLFPSPGYRQDFLNTHPQIPADSATVIPNAVDLDLFRPVPRRERSGLRVGFAGQWVPGKGCIALLEAWRTVRASFPEAELWFAGGARLWKGTFEPPGAEEVARKIEEAAREGWLKIVGERPRAEMPSFWHALDVAVVPSFEEAFGLVALEALACGVPVVASDVGGLKDIIVDQDCGFFVPPNNPERLAQAIVALLTNQDLRSRMAQRARARAEVFTAERRAREMWSLLSRRANTR